MVAAMQDDFPSAGFDAFDANLVPETEAHGTVDFGDEGQAKLSGRRRKVEAKKKASAKAGSFDALGLSVEILRGIRRKGYQLPTPIQRKAMPPILAGADVVGMARTGSGKTAAFVIPMLQLLEKHAQRAGARAVILAPTRELALQTAKVVRELGRHMDLRLAILVGGDSMEAQFAELAGNPDVIVATPGRLAHHLAEVSGFSLKTVEYVVFDEADRLFEMGFAEQLKQILSGMGESRQTLLFSATMPSALAEFARAGLREPTLIRLDVESKISPDLGLAFFTVREDDKLAALLYLVREVIPEGRPTLIFASTRHHVDLLSQLLAAEGIPAAYVYGTLDQAARKINIAKFRAGRVQFLIVTDVAARGIDIPLLDNVVNFDFPPQPKLFVHRVGRAARAGRTGTAYSLMCRDEIPYALDLHLFLARKLLPAPKQSISQASSSQEVLSPDTSLVGSFPLVALEATAEHVRETIAASADLQSAATSAGKAFQLYRKTRPGPSLESVKRAKQMPQEGLHPLLARSLPATALGGLEAQEGMAAISAALRNYRPAQTVLQASVAGPKAATGARPRPTKRARLQPAPAAAAAPSGLLTSRQAGTATEAAVLASDAALPQGNGALPMDDGSDSDAPGGNSSADDGDSDLEAAARVAAKGKRGRGGATGSHRKKLVLPEEPAATGKFKAGGLYIPHVRTGPQDDAGYSVHGPGAGAGGMEAAVMDMVGEDAEGIASTRGAYHWDKRHRKYVQLQPGEALRAGKRVRTDSGAPMVSKGKKGGKDESGGIYEKWSKQQRRHIPATGTMENRKGKGFDPSLADRFKNGGRGWENPMKAGKQFGKSPSGKSPSGKSPSGKSPGGKHELRSAEEVAKARKLAERKVANSKGKDGGKRGAGKDEPPARGPYGGGGWKGLEPRGGGVGKRKGGGKRPKGAAPSRVFKGDKATRGKGGGGKGGGQSRAGGKGGKRR